MYRSVPIVHYVPSQVRAWTVAVAMLVLGLPGCDWPNATSTGSTRVESESSSRRDYRDRLGALPIEASSAACGQGQFPPSA